MLNPAATGYSPVSDISVFSAFRASLFRFLFESRSTIWNMQSQYLSTLSRIWCCNIRVTLHYVMRKSRNKKIKTVSALRGTGTVLIFTNGVSFFKYITMATETEWIMLELDLLDTVQQFLLLKLLQQRKPRSRGFHGSKFWVGLGSGLCLNISITWMDPNWHETNEKKMRTKR